MRLYLQSQMVPLLSGTVWRGPVLSGVEGTLAREKRAAKVEPAGYVIFKSRKNNRPAAGRESPNFFQQLHARSKSAGKSARATRAATISCARSALRIRELLYLLRAWDWRSARVLSFPARPPRPRRELRSRARHPCARR